MTITFGAYYVARYPTFNKFFIAFYEPQEFFVVFIYLFIIIIFFFWGGNFLTREEDSIGGHPLGHVGACLLNT